ncbi:L-cystine transporter [Woeseia oceani]|uniref:L-cystine transporter tcyP n=1 Tax=Woeseia oceani TaxID=1548547 RepID=A0A193LL58_9GAMM|nr:L-cystine transporter [Woeseia oceani]ANO53186.1 L-cystine transporter tcyP [Woeseia oceani]
MALVVPLNLLVFAGLILALVQVRKLSFTLSQQILAGLIAGVAFGFVLQVVYAGNPAAIDETLVWTNVVASTYIKLLQMVIMPLVLVMMISAVVRMREVAALGRIGGVVIGILVGTTMIAALVGITMANLFNLTAEGLTEGARELARASALESRLETVESLGLADMLVRFIPSNIFYDLTGARPTSIIAVVIFGVLFGVAALQVGRENAERGDSIGRFVETVQVIIMKLVRIIMAFTPYGILALMTKVVAGSNIADILNLLTFVVASYAAIAIMFSVHALLLLLNGVNIRRYLQNVWPVLTFAFTSRSSAATIPLNVETQIDKLGVPTSIANLAATFGATIGQNGCAGIYPAMLATMVAPTMGINTLDPSFIAGLVGIVAISSFGVAGVGGGATFAALIVLPAMGMPIALVALLISIEPLIDMGRTALNVNGSMTAGVLTSRLLKDLPQDDAAAVSESA